MSRTRLLHWLQAAPLVGTIAAACEVPVTYP